MTIKNQNEFPVFLQYFLFLLSAGLYLLLMFIDDFRSQLINYYLIITPIYVCYFCIVWIILKRNNSNLLSLRRIIFFAACLRLCVLVVKPPAFAAETLAGVENPDYLSSLLVSVLILAAETGLYITLERLITYFSLERQRLGLLMLNPLIILELYYFNRIGIVAILFFWLAVWLFYRRLSWWSIPVFAAAAFVAGFCHPAALPFLIRKFWYKLVLLIAFGILVMYLVYWSNVPHALLAGHAFVGFFYGGYLLIKEGAMAAGQATPDAGSHPLYYGAAALVLLIVLANQLKKAKRFEAYHSVVFLQASFIIMGVVLLLVPRFAAWHGLWILPYMIFLPRWCWLAFSFFVQGSYLAPGNASIAISQSWLPVIYLPFLILLLVEYYDRRKLKGWLP
jgi:hypothetical protein